MRFRDRCVDNLNQNLRPKVTCFHFNNKEESDSSSGAYKYGKLSTSEVLKVELQDIWLVVADWSAVATARRFCDVKARLRTKDSHRQSTLSLLEKSVTMITNQLSAQLFFLLTSATLLCRGFEGEILLL